MVAAATSANTVRFIAAPFPVFPDPPTGCKRECFIQFGLLLGSCSI
jgi:hypothetical protein